MKPENFSDKFNYELADRFHSLSTMSYPSKENRSYLREAKKLLKTIIKEQGFLECMAKSHQFHLPDSAEYFFARVMYIFFSIE